MLKSLYIQNFQSHKKTNLTFHKGVNVIVGASDSGKSAIRRAVQWVDKNRPLGDGFRSHWGGDTSVEIRTEEAAVKRQRTNKENNYVIGDITFNALKSSVPDEVKKVLNFSDLNTQSQIDAPFLLNDNPGEVARHFNKIAHIDKINTSISKVSGNLRRLKSKKESTTEDLKTKQKELKAYNKLIELEKEVSLLEEREQEIKNNKEQIQAISTFIDQYQLYSSKYEKLGNVEALLSSINDLIKLKESIKADELFIKELNKIITTYTELSDKLKKYENYPNISVIDETLGMMQEVKKDRRKLAELSNLIDNHANTINNLKIKEKEVKELEIKIKKEMPDTCPLCNTKLK